MRDTTAILGSLCALALAACEVGVQLPGGSAAEAPAPVAKAPATPPAPIARAPSYAELLRACPLEPVVFADLRKQLDAGRYAEVDAVADRMLAGHRQTAACEGPVWETLGYLASLEFPVLDRWAAARPDSWAVFTARGGRWVDTGYARRGTHFSKDVTQEQWAGMADAFAHAQSDLQRALELEPDGFVAYGFAINMLKASGNPKEIHRWLDALLARDPLNYGVRRRAMQALDVMWGGSLDEMQEIAEQAQRYADENPRLRILPGYVEAQIGETAYRAKRYPEAAQAYRRALAYGGFTDWYGMLADALMRQSAWKELAEVSEQWIAEFGDNPTARMWRGQARVGQGDLAGGVADYDASIAQSPEYALAWRVRGQARRRSGQLTEARDDFRRSLQLDPANGWAQEQLATLEAALVAQAEARRAGRAADAAQGGAGAQAPRTLPALSRIPANPAES